MFSLGAIIYQLITAAQPLDCLKRALDVWSGKPDPQLVPIEINLHIPPFFSAAIVKALAVDPEYRFTSAMGMKQALAEHYAKWKSEGGR